MAFNIFDKIAEQPQQKFTLEDIKNAKLPWEWFLWGLSEAIAGGVRVWEQIPRYAWNIAWLAYQWLGEASWFIWEQLWVSKESNPFYQSGMELSAWSKKLWEDITRAGEGNISEKQRELRRTGASLVATAPIPLWTVPKFLQWAGIASTVGRGAYYGAVWTPVYTGIEEWRLPDISEIAVWTVWWAILWPVAEKFVIPWITKWVEKTVKYGTELTKWGTKWLKKSIFRDIEWVKTWIWSPLTRTLPAKIVENNIWLTPTERGKIESITWDSPANFVLKNNLATNEKDVLANSLQKKADDSYNGITTALKWIWEKEQVKSDDAKKMLGTMLEEMNKSDIIKREMPEYISTLWEWMNKDSFTPYELNALRRDFDRIVWSKIFNAQWRTTNAEDKIIAGWREKVSQEIQDTAEKYGIDVKQLNSDLRTSIIMRDWVLRRLSQENKNNTFGLQDLWVWAILWSGDPVTSTAIIFGKKALEQQAPNIAQKLYNFNKAPNVPKTNLKRGVTISPRDTTSGLSITPTIRPSKLTQVEPVDYSNIPWATKLKKEYPRGKTVRLKWDVDNPSNWPTKLLPATTKSSELANQRKIQSVKEEIIWSTKTAQFWGTGNQKLEATINRKLDSGEITREEAIDIATDVYESVWRWEKVYSYIDNKKLESYINDLYSNKKSESFDDLLNEKQIVKPKVKTDEQIWIEINRSSLDRRRSTSIDTLIEEFKKRTGKDPLNVKESDFIDWKLKPSKKPLSTASTKLKSNTNTPKNIQSSPIEEKSTVKAKTLKSNQKTDVKQPLSNTKSSDSIPDGYFKNVFWEIVKKPNNKTGGFVKLPELKSAESKLIEEAKKYRTPRELYNNLDQDTRQLFDRKWIWSLKHFEDFYKKNITLKKWELTVYRWQSKQWKEVQYNDTNFQWNTEWWVFFTTNKETANKYGKNIIEMKSNKLNTVSYKEAEKLQKMAEQKVKQDLKNWIQTRDIIEQMALWRPKAFAEYTKKPFIETWDMFWEPWELIYYKHLDKKIP